MAWTGVTGGAVAGEKGGRMASLESFDAIRISLASPGQIRAWSSGEVTEPETLNYRTLKPEDAGLFSERIFGPVKDWTCGCGRYRKVHFAGLVCEQCGVEVGPSSLRRERMGHIELAAPVAHPWYAGGTPNRMALLLGMTPRQLKGVLSGSLFIVTAIDARRRRAATARLHREVSGRSGDPAAELLPRREYLRLLQDLRTGSLLDDAQVRTLSENADSVCSTGTGAGVLQGILAALDLDELATRLRCGLARSGSLKSKRDARRLEIVEALRTSGVNPSWMILSVLPVLPPDLRPMVPLDGGRYATTDVNDLYCRVIYRNNRIKRLSEKRAPEIIMRNERRLLQEAVDALFDNAHRKRPLLGPTRHPLKSLSDALSGKQGRFRRNLLGKRVDYSGRSVICAGLQLQLHQCGLPKKIALELFKPFVMRKLVERNVCPAVRAAKRMVERGTRAPDVVWDLLEEVMMERPVLLNRAPTLHRLGLQAFEPVLVEGSAIQLHPLVCGAFNADFDGDQMAVHLPLSDAASREAYRLMLSTRTLRSPATGEPSVAPSQEMVLGCFYLTEARPGARGEGRRFSDPTEAQVALEHGIIDLQASIRVRLAQPLLYEAPPPQPPRQIQPGDLIETTVGRLIFNEVLPDRLGFRNYATKKEYLKQLVGECLAACGPARTAEVADALKSLGFRYATRSGISFAMSDISVPPEKQSLVARADEQAHEVEELLRSGMITESERRMQLIDLWTRTTDEISQLLEARLDPWGTLSTIIKSGATKAKFQQIRQLSGIRGLMASPLGEIIPLPVKGNYLEGLRVWELFIAASGARKGFMDRSLNTATSGYRTLILVEVGRTVAVTEEDCGESEGVLITDEESRAAGLPDMRTRITSRVLARPIEAGGERLAAGTLLDDALCTQLLSAGVCALRVRSPLTCLAPRGICRLCYGTDLATGQLVERGAAVGVIAAQSIGEPGTQLTMRTFHSGGIAGAQGDITQGLPRINELFEAHIPPSPAVLSEIEGEVEINQSSPTDPPTVRVVCTLPVLDDYPLPPAWRLTVSDGEPVRPGQPLATPPGADSGEPLVARTGGTAHLAGGLLSIQSEDREERTYSIPPRRKLLVSAGQHVAAGTPLCLGPLNPQEVLRTRGRTAAALYLVHEVQTVYRTTGVYLHDKHAEIIVRQMLRWLVVEDAGDTTLIPGALIDRFRFCDINAGVLAQGGQPARARPVLLGTIRVALNNESWLAAAAFQQTVRVLAQAAIGGKTDYLRDAKQHIIVGKRLPGR
jgi:DNA-directed RNA polymerase subunit beta'